MTGTRGPGPGDHETYDELAVGWALHALEPEDEAAFAAHLAGCGRCARTVAETAEVMAAMATDLPPAEPSEQLRDRLRAAVEDTEQVPRPQPPPVSPPRPAEPERAQTGEPAAARHPARGVPPVPIDEPRPPGATRLPDGRTAWRRVLPHALVAAGVAAILALGAWSVALDGDRQAAQARVAEQSAMLEALLSPGRVTIAPLSADGRRVATVVARDGQVQVLADGLEVNEADESTYVVWGVREGSPAVPLGTFDVVSPDRDLRTVGSTATGLDDFSTYALSIEPGRQAPSAPTDIVANGQVTS
jgi:anti-sigma-K factor RskA